MDFSRFYLALLVIFSVTAVICSQRQSSPVKNRAEKKCSANQTLITTGCESPCGPKCLEGFIVIQKTCQASCFRGCRCSKGYVEFESSCISSKDCRSMKTGTDKIDRNQYQILSN